MRKRPAGRSKSSKAELTEPGIKLRDYSEAELAAFLESDRLDEQGEQVRHRFCDALTNQVGQHDQDWTKQPPAEELARRQKLVAEILANRKERVISPYTAADLVHAAREGRELE